MILSENLLISLLAKEIQGIEYLYENYSSLLYGICFKVLQHHEIAEEVFHDSFLKIIYNISSYDAEKGTLATWMIKITRNQAIDYLRSKINKDNNRILREWKDDRKSPCQSQNGIGTSELLLKSGLTASELQILDLVYFNDYTQSEIASEFNIPLGTVKTKIRSSLQKLRRHLTNDIQTYYFDGYIKTSA